MKTKQKKSPGGKAGAKGYSRSDQSADKASPAPVGVPAVVSYVYYHLDLHRRVVRTTKPPGRECVETTVLDLGGGELVEELRVIRSWPMSQAVLHGRDGEQWVSYEHPDDPECEYWRRPYTEKGGRQ